MLILMATAVPLVKAQSTGGEYTLSGYVKDSTNAEVIGFAIITVKETNTTVTSNLQGFYTLKLPKGTYNILIKSIGYKDKNFQVNLTADKKLDVQLSTEAEVLKTIEYTTEKENQNVTTAEMGVTKIDIKEIADVPVVFGEKDVLKTIQLLPGISSAGEGSGGFFVRGGSIDQNLVMIDDAPVYNPSHLLGFFSVFNSDALDNMEIYKWIPSEYGGRVSSVLDVKMKDGDFTKPSLEGGIGVISSRLTASIPIKKDRGAILVSGRRTYADVFLKLSPQERLRESSLYFYDLNLKGSYILGDNDRIAVSGYLGRDNFGFSDDFGFDWGNKTSTLNWNHAFEKNLVSDVSLIYSHYDYELNIDDGLIKLSSNIRDFQLKHDFELFVNENNKVKFGYNAIHHKFNPSQLSSNGDIGLDDLQVQNRFALEGAAYIGNEQKLSDKLNLNYGIRYSVFNFYGPGSFSTYNDDGSIIETKSYDKGEVIQSYGGLEPRISSAYAINDSNSVKASYSRNLQYMHLLSNSTSSTPVDLWIPASQNVKPIDAHQVSIGYFKNLKDNKYEASVELYYKTMGNLIDYKTGAEIFLNEDVESQLVYGKGWAYGAEFLVRKAKGDFKGWISYTLSRSRRKFDDIDDGQVYSSRQDRIHDLSITGIYKASKKITLSANFVIYTGDAVTLPTGKYTVNGDTYFSYGDRNSERMPLYHRMDVGLTLHSQKERKYESSWNFSIYNLYGRKNAFSLGFRESEENPNVTETVKTSLFAIIPSITWNFKF